MLPFLPLWISTKSVLVLHVWFLKGKDGVDDYEWIFLLKREKEGVDGVGVDLPFKKVKKGDDGVGVDVSFKT